MLRATLAREGAAAAQAGATPPAGPSPDAAAEPTPKTEAEQLRIAVDDARIANAVASTLHRTGAASKDNNLLVVVKRLDGAALCAAAELLSRLALVGAPVTGGCARADAPKALATAGAFDAASPPKAVVNALARGVAARTDGRARLGRRRGVREGAETGDARALPPAALEIRGRADARQGLQPRGQPLPPLGRVLPRVSGSAARRGERARLRDTMRVGRRRRATRKFACFALGNAAFHSSDLYAALEPGAPPLCSLPRQRQRREGARERRRRAGEPRAERRRPGRGARTGGRPRALVAAAREDAAAGPRRIALFSLGTLAAWSAVRRVLEVEPLRSALSTALAAADKSRDATQRKPFGARAL